ncbi:unnamed protein product, partial [Mesorhabditis spiculigera]
MSNLPYPWLWNLLFFIMLAFLGLSTAVVDTLTIITCIVDSSESFRRYATHITGAVCLALFLGSVTQCTNAGIYMVQLMDDCNGGIALGVGILLEFLLIAHYYDIAEALGSFSTNPLEAPGWGRMRHDLQAAFGPPRNMLTTFVGKSGYLFWALWKVTPLMGGAVLLYEMSTPPSLAYKDYEFPALANWLGYLYGNLTLLVVIGFFVFNVVRMGPKAFRVHPTHPSYIKMSHPARPPPPRRLDDDDDQLELLLPDRPIDS